MQRHIGLVIDVWVLLCAVAVGELVRLTRLLNDPGFLAAALTALVTLGRIVYGEVLLRRRKRVLDNREAIVAAREHSLGLTWTRPQFEGDED